MVPCGKKNLAIIITVRTIIEFRLADSINPVKMFKKFPFTKKKIPAFLRNKFLLASVAFLVWMLFFDDNNIFSQVQLRMRLHEYELKKEYYQVQIEDVNKEKKELLTNQASLEKFAREHYMMKKDNEDLYVIVPGK